MLTNTHSGYGFVDVCSVCGQHAWYRNGYGECIDCGLKSGRPGAVEAVKFLVDRGRA